MFPEELRKLIASNAKAIEALASQQAEQHQAQLERQRAMDRQIAELTRTVGAVVRETSGAVATLIENRATMYELITQVSESQATMNEPIAQIAAAITQLANQSAKDP